MSFIIAMCFCVVPVEPFQIVERFYRESRVLLAARFDTGRVGEISQDEAVRIARVFLLERTKGRVRYEKKVRAYFLAKDRCWHVIFFQKPAQPAGEVEILVDLDGKPRRGSKSEIDEESAGSPASRLPSARTSHPAAIADR